VPEQHAAALVGISFLAVLTKGGVGGLRELEHRWKSEVRSQIAEIKFLPHPTNLSDGASLLQFDF
jgi:hypothetical protein